MRKFLPVLFLVVLCVCLCACGQTESDMAKWDAAANALEEAAGTRCTVDVNKTAFINVTVSIPESDDFSLFGTRAYNTINAALPYNREVKCDTPEQLARFFPALDLRLKEEHNLTEEEIAIWDAVWKKLDSEPDRDEMDIYEELAPTYDMSAEDLDALIKALLEKAYQDYQ